MSFNLTLIPEMHSHISTAIIEKILAGILRFFSELLLNNYASSAQLINFPMTSYRYMRNAIDKATNLALFI